MGLNLLLKYLYVFLLENYTIGYFKLPMLSNIEFTTTWLVKRKAYFED